VGEDALPVMKRAQARVFLITASTAALRPRPGGQIYAASKGAVVTLAKALALEVAPHGVRVVAICPSPRTPDAPTFMGKQQVDDEGLKRVRATVRWAVSPARRHRARRHLPRPPTTRHDHG